MKLPLNKNDIAFVFSSEGPIVVATGDGLEYDAEGTIERAEALISEAMDSGDQGRAVAASIAAMTLGMIVSPEIRSRLSSQMAGGAR